MQVEIEPYDQVIGVSSAPTPLFTTILLTSVLALAGIGGVCSVTQTGDVASTSTVIVRPFVASESENDSEIDPGILGLHLTRIRESLGLSMTEMADILNVSRTALYGWFNGTVPHPKQTKRINELLSFADLAAQSKIRRITLTKNVPLSQGKTLLQVLIAKGDVPGALAEVREMAIAQTASTQSRLSRMARKEKILGAEDITPSFSTFE
jgi:transcriptional regulator with XRE-family HTH domain